VIGELVEPMTTPRASAPPAPVAPARTAGIFGVGAALPDAVVTNDDLAAVLDTSDEWIVKRTGIRERRPLADAHRDAEDVDRIVVATTTADRIVPGLGPEVAAALGLRCPAYDVNAACAGFLYALDEAAAAVESGRARCVLVCGADALSRITDHGDRSTAVLLADGAGAVVVAGGELDLGCRPFVLGSDPGRADLLGTDARGLLRMQGREVYRHAVDRMAEAAAEALRRANLGVEDVDALVAHQANARIVEATAVALGLPRERVALNVDRVANTSAASVPLALADAERDGLLRPGATVLLAAFGAGFVWGAGIVSWKERRDVCA